MPIYVVGAGPGDPKLLTLRAVELLSKADVVAYGDLVPEEIVKLYARGAAVVKIGHRREEHDAAVAALIEEAKRGKTVVVLKNGDPTIFGRGIQICKEAERRGVECEIVPGVSAFMAAAALYKIELTNGTTLRHITLLSYPHVDAQTLKNAADTLVIHMMGDHLSELVKMLQDLPNVEIYACYAITQGGKCEKTEIGKLEEYRGKKPLLIIVRKVPPAPSLNSGASCGI